MYTLSFRASITTLFTTFFLQISQIKLAGGAEPCQIQNVIEVTFLKKY
jgi:hypothetical protein